MSWPHRHDLSVEPRADPGGDKAHRLSQGCLDGIHDVIGFHGETVAKLRAAFVDAVDDYIKTCAKIGNEPQRPDAVPTD